MTHVCEERRFGAVGGLSALLRRGERDLVCLALADLAPDADLPQKFAGAFVVRAAGDDLEPDIVTVGMTNPVGGAPDLAGRWRSQQQARGRKVVGMDEGEVAAVLEFLGRALQ